LKFDPTRAPFARQGPTSFVPPRHRYYWSSPTPARITAQAPVSLAFGLRRPTELTGIPGSRVILFERAANRDPAECAARFCAIGYERRCCLRTAESLGHSEQSFLSRLTSRGSLACPPTHRRTRCRPASALSPIMSVARCGFRRAWPASSCGDRTRWMTAPHFLELFAPPVLADLSSLVALRGNVARSRFGRQLDVSAERCSKSIRPSARCFRGTLLEIDSAVSSLLPVRGTLSEVIRPSSSMFRETLFE